MLHPHYKSNQVWHTSAQISSAVQAHVFVPPLVKSFLYHIVIPCCKKSDKMSNLKNQKKLLISLNVPGFIVKKFCLRCLKQFLSDFSLWPLPVLKPFELQKCIVSQLKSTSLFQQSHLSFHLQCVHHTLLFFTFVVPGALSALGYHGVAEIPSFWNFEM